MSVYETLPKAQDGRHVHLGHVARDATDMSARIWVVLPDFDSNQQWGPCRWQSRDDTTLPSEGDPCLVILDNRNEPWVVAWWPYLS